MYLRNSITGPTFLIIVVPCSWQLGLLSIQNIGKSAKAWTVRWSMPFNLRIAQSGDWPLKSFIIFLCTAEAISLKSIDYLCFSKMPTRPTHNDNSYLSIFGTSVEHGMRRVFMVFVLYWLRYTDTFFMLIICIFDI